MSGLAEKLTARVTVNGQVMAIVVLSYLMELDAERVAVLEHRPALRSSSAAIGGGWICLRLGIKRILPGARNNNPWKRSQLPGPSTEMLLGQG